MILGGKTLKERIQDKSIVVEPVDESQVQPASVDLRLSDEFLILDDNTHSHIDLSSEMNYRTVNSNEFILPPHSFVLAGTKEYVEIPLDVTAFVEGRSSIGRLGLFIQNAGWVDPGFKGNITLEFYNANSLPIKLEAGRRICQLVFVKLDVPLEKGYTGKYLGQRGVTGSRAHKDTESKQTQDENPPAE